MESKFAERKSFSREREKEKEKLSKDKAKHLSHVLFKSADDESFELFVPN